MTLWKIADIAKAANKEPSTIEKWHAQGKLGTPIQKRPRRWDKDDVLERIENMVDKRKTLTDLEVIAIKIRAGAGENQKSIAAAFGVTSAHISHIVNGKRRMS